MEVRKTKVNSVLKERRERRIQDSLDPEQNEYVLRTTETNETTDIASRRTTEASAGRPKDTSVSSRSICFGSTRGGSAVVESCSVLAASVWKSKMENGSRTKRSAVVPRCHP